MESDCPFWADVSPGGAYFKRSEGKEPPKDENMWWAFKVKGIGWGYCDVDLIAYGDLEYAAPDRGHNLVILHSKYVGKNEILYRVGEWVLISPFRDVTK